jgi:hypothetical protein
MKATIALGLGMLCLVGLVALRGTDIRSHPVAEVERDWAKSHPASRVASARRSAFHATHTTRQPAQSVQASLLAAVEAETDPDRRGEALKRTAAAVSDADLPAELDLLTRDPDQAADELRQLLVRRWAESDAPAAATWASQLPEGPIRCAALEQVAIAWANTDLPVAADWVRALPESDSRAASTLALAYEAARTEPVLALELAGALPPTRERDELLAHAVSQWAVGNSTIMSCWLTPSANGRWAIPQWLPLGR